MLKYPLKICFQLVTKHGRSLGQNVWNLISLSIFQKKNFHSHHQNHHIFLDFSKKKNFNLSKIFFFQKSLKNFKNSANFLVAMTTVAMDTASLVTYMTQVSAHHRP